MLPAKTDTDGLRRKFIAETEEFLVRNWARPASDPLRRPDDQPRADRTLRLEPAPGQSPPRPRQLAA